MEHMVRGNVIEFWS